MRLVLGIAICTKSANSQEGKHATDPAALEVVPITRSGWTLSSPLTWTHDADGTLPPLWTDLNLKRYQLVQTGAPAIAGESGYVDEKIARAIGRSDKAKAPIIIPPGQSTVSTYGCRLTIELSGARADV